MTLRQMMLSEDGVFVSRGRGEEKCEDKELRVAEKA